MHKKLSLGLLFGFVGNLLFIIFALVCFIYYKTFNSESAVSDFLEISAYVCLFSGFGVLTASDVLIAISVRMRKTLKASFTLYILMEAFMMYCELHSFAVRDFYQPYSVWLAIIHAVLSAAACFTFITLDPYKNQFEMVIIICIGVILGGMFGNLLGIRIYFSILVNAIAYSMLFLSIRSLMKKGIVEIDCYGDRARVAEYKGFFEGDEEPQTDAMKLHGKKNTAETAPDDDEKETS